MQPENSSQKSSKQVKNIRSDMTERNTSYCILCKSKPSDLVNHYVRSHKCEPYVARLSEDELKDLLINWPSAIPCVSNAEDPRDLEYKTKCVFCEDELIDSFNNFYHHFSTHTGEYGFQCENCKLQKPFRADIQSHKHHSKSCRNAHIQTMYVYPPNLMTIYLHCCTICNFVQLNEANIHKHLRDHHDQPTSYNSTLVQKYIAAAIDDGKIVNEAFQESDILKEEEMEEMPECKQEFIMEDELALNASETKLILPTPTVVSTDVQWSTDTPSLHLLAYKISSFEKQLKELKEVVNDGFTSIIRILSGKRGKASAASLGGKNEIQRFKIIKSVEELQEFNAKLEDRACYEYVFDTFKLSCNDPAMEPMNISYSLIDLMVERNVLQKCSWKGGSRTAGVKKIALEKLTNFRKVFLQLVRIVHPSYAESKMRVFWDAITTNAKNRANNKRLRASRQKNRKRANMLFDNEDNDIDDGKSIIDPEEFSEFKIVHDDDNLINVDATFRTDEKSADEEDYDNNKKPVEQHRVDGKNSVVVNTSNGRQKRKFEDMLGVNKRRNTTKPRTGPSSPLESDDEVLGE